MKSAVQLICSRFCLDGIVILSLATELLNATSGLAFDNGCHEAAKYGFHCQLERVKESPGGCWTGTS